MTKAQREILVKVLGYAKTVDSVYFTADTKDEYLSIRFTVGPRYLFTKVWDREGNLVRRLCSVSQLREVA